MSGRSSLSTFTQTKALLSKAATSSSVKHSLSITWHQWQLEYPIERNTGLSSLSALSKASFPQGYQSTGFSACWRRYGLFSFASLFGMAYVSSIADGKESARGGKMEKEHRSSFDSSTNSLLRTNGFNG